MKIKVERCATIRTQHLVTSAMWTVRECSKMRILLKIRKEPVTVERAT